MVNATRKNESGQALIFVIATMTVALAVGVGISLRNLSSISRTSRSDTAARAQAAAEGGAENILAKTEEELINLADTGEVTTITYTPTANDNITAVAEVTVEHYTLPAGQAYLPLTIQEGRVSEVRLDGGGVTVCWSSLDPEVGSDIYLSVYNNDGDVSRAGVEASNRDGFPAQYTSNFLSSGPGQDNFSDCHDVTQPAGASVLRIRSLNSDSSVGVYPDTGDLPSQGYLITSVGKLQNVAQGEDAEAVVTVIRSHSYMPGVFDFGVFSGSPGAAFE
jgi:hypothetical protein